MDPARFQGVQPRALDGQLTGEDAYASALLLDLPIVLPDPALHCLATVPGGVVPDQEQCRRAACGQPGTAVGQEVRGDGADGATVTEAQPYLLRLLLREPQ